MRIRSTRCHRYILPLRQPWRSAHGQLGQRSGLLLELSTDCGQRGYGDAAPLPELGSETLAESAQWLARHLPALSGLDPHQALSLLGPPDHCPSARCALETALLDLLAQRQHLPLRRLLNREAEERLEVNANLGALDDRAAERLGRNAGFRVYKLKVGLAPVAEELLLLQRLAAAIPAGVTLRLDANCAWSAACAEAFLTGLGGLPVESLEEPLARPTLASLAILQQSAPCALALDESIRGLGLTRLLNRPPVRRLVLKPMLHGGLLTCLNIAGQARQAGLEVLVTTSLDSAAGTWAAAQLAAALGPTAAHLPHGLVTSGWFAEDLGPSPQIHHGVLRLPDRPGLGFRPSWECEGLGAPP